MPGLVTALAVVAAPVLAGLAGTVVLAFRGAAGSDDGTWSLDGVRALLDWPGLPASAALSLGTGIAAGVLSLILAIALVAASTRLTRTTRLVWVTPLLAVPYAAVAFGLAFLLAPSGWIARLLSPWATGWRTPPDLATIQDGYGMALVAGLVVKETPFLVAATLAATVTIRAPAQLRIAAALGYAPATAWLKIVLPQIWPLLRLPFWAVVAYGVGSVDTALVLGPTAPPTLAVQALRWSRDWDLARWQPAAAAALGVALLAALAIGILWLTERVAARLARARLEDGARTSWTGPAVTSACVTATLLPLLGLGALLVLAIWSVATQWRFPDALPAGVGLSTWAARGGAALWPLATTAVIATAAASVGAVLAVAWLAALDPAARPTRGTLVPARLAAAVLWLPLLVPAASFVLGAQALLAFLSLQGTTGAVVVLHLVYALPYGVLVLAGPWARLDPRWSTVAATLGAGPWRELLTVRLPLLLRPMLLAVAVMAAVSVDQYLTTLAAGGGRVATLTTEALALGAGGDRRIVATLALLQAALPLLAFALALAIPARLARERRGLRAETT